MKPTLFIALAIPLLFVAACGSDAGKRNSDSVNVNGKPEGPDCWAKADFENVDLGEDSMGVPHTVVKVKVCDELEIVDTVIGNMTSYDKTQMKDMDIPDNAVAACGGWFAGGGDYYYIVSDNDGVEVYHGWQDEGVDTPGYNWEKMKEIH